MQQGIVIFRLFVVLVATALIGSCSTGPGSKPSGVIKIGNPYEINGRRYVPAHQPWYDEVGMGSWYGPGFHGRYTANGERFDKNDLTAAHPTLPMPSIVRVTNLENGRSVMVRINDRGPFARNRIIDLSEAAAKRLDIKNRGVAQVRVQYLPGETRSYLASLSPNKPVDYASLTPAVPAPSPPLEDLAMESEPTETTIQEPEPFVAQPIDRSTSPAMPLPVVDTADLQSEDTVAPTQPRSTPVAASNASIVIQVASFGIEENAKRLMYKLKQLGAFEITQITINSRTWYRVHSEPLNDIHEAGDLLKQVMALGLKGAHIIGYSERGV